MNVRDMLHGDWICRSCSKKNRAAFRFCEFCGEQKTSVSGISAGMDGLRTIGKLIGKEDARTPQQSCRCPKCGQSNAPTNAFCKGCGYRLKAVEPEAHKTEPVTKKTIGKPSEITVQKHSATGVRRCPQCGSSCEPGVAFCLECGVAL